MGRFWVGFVLTTALLLSTMTAAPAQGRGHGAIYYSSSGQRIGWAHSLPDDPTADHVAQAMCQGGQIDRQSLNAFSNQQGGISATGSGPALSTFLNDCHRIVKFDSGANHQCGGFGFSSNGQSSSGVREQDRRAVQDHLSNWPHAFIICNDDASVSGIDRFATALGNLASALGGGNQNSAASSSQGSAMGNAGNCGQYISTGSVLTWRSFLNGSLHSQGELRITKVDGNYFEAIQTENGMNQVQMYGMTNDNFVGLLNPNSDEAWIGQCSTSNINGFVKQYTFTLAQ